MDNLQIECLWLQSEKYAMQKAVSDSKQFEQNTRNIGIW